MRYSFLLISALFAFTAQAQTTTFNVDMTCAPEGFTDVFVTGPWCGWCANDVYNTMTDADGDGIYTVTLDTTVTGLIEYKYAINGFADQENLINDMVAGASCAPVTDYNGYANRQIQQGSVANDYYGSCDGVCNDAPPVDITFQVDMSQYAGAYTTVNLNGSFNGWCGTCAPMSDADGDGIYDITVTVAPDTIEYKFTVDGWTAQEEFAGGESCTSTIDGFTNRTLIADATQTLAPVCWNSCDACVEAQYAVTFQVDMSEQTTNPIGVFIAGNFQGWTEGATPMTDADGDDVWEYTTMIAEGTAVEYKFINGPNWGLDESVPVACAVNGNRGYTVGAADATLDVVCFGSCTACGSSLPTEEVTFTVLTDNITVAADGMYLAGAMNAWTPEPMNDNGDGSWSITKSLEAATYEFKYQNGNGGWEELDCGGNRSVVVTIGTPIATQGCFGQCAETCAIDPDPADVTFQVDASQITVDSAGMYLIGSFTSPAWQFGAVAMDDTDGDGVWTATVNISGPAAFQYKFNNGPAVIDSAAFFGGEENADFVAGGCGVDNGVGGSNRVHERSGVAETLPVVCFNSCEACVAAPATLVATVDVCGAAATEVRLTGPFWGWDPGAGPVATDNGDGTWSVTFDPAPDADMEYLWIVDGVQENLIGVGDCTPITDGATYANRLWTVGSADISDVYASCTACETTGGGSTIFNVDMSCIDGAGATVNGATTFTEVFVTGPWCGWCAADGYNVLTDADGDGIYSVEIADLTGTIEYKYGIDGFTDQEQLVDDMANGADCAPVTDFAGYANRQVAAGSTTNDTFGSCATCADQVEPANVTFKVDMNQYAEAYAYSGVFLNGSFNGWCGTCNPMDDADGDGVWELTLSLNPGTIEYKFTLDGWNYQEELAGIAGIEACTSLIDGFTNRTLTFDADVVLDAVCWESCDACAVVEDVLGCTNPFYVEFDPFANIDNGSCTNLIVLGCTYDVAVNYSASANTDDGSCQFDGGANDCPSDLDGDGVTATGDLLAFLASFGATCL
jgi:1,4-alpha-glucan branching enzyme